MTLWQQLTDAQREDLVVRMVAAFATGDRDTYVPEHLRAGLLRYFSDGILPGGFLQAVLCNDLRTAVQRGQVSLAELRGIVNFLNIEAPHGSWASRENVLNWTTTPERLEI